MTQNCSTPRRKQGKGSLTLVFAMIFLDMSPKVQATKAKINNQYYSQLKTFCTAKEMIDKMKRQPTEWGKISANYICGSG